MDGLRLLSPELPVSHYRIRFNIIGSWILPGYPGSAVRGAFGHALKKTVCVTRQKQCKDCMLYRTCPYSYLFETPPPLNTEKMRRYTAAPHPFVFELPLDPPAQSPGKVLDIGFRLFGRGNQFLPYVLHALEAAGKEGIGGQRGQRNPLRLDRLEQAVGYNNPQWHTIYQPGETLTPLPAVTPAIPDMPDTITLHFETPLRLSRDNHNIQPGQFEFSDLFITLMRRLSMLSYFHTDKALETDFSDLAEHARTIAFSHKQLDWHDWARYSSRQNKRIMMGGLIGSAELNMAGLEAFWPYLWLGQWTHVGKGTSMGLGHYRIEMPASLPTPTQAGA